jgi:pyroglutamyl-peptidase
VKILVTGFEPFGGKEINSSWETAARIGMLSFDGVDVEVRRLPVSFCRVGECIDRLLDEVQPDVLLMLGQRTSGSSIDIERVAVNLMDAAKPDNDGQTPDEQQVNPSGETAYFTKMPVKVLRDALLQKGIASRVSNSAGLFVCNCTYYNALHAISSRGLHTAALFVHLPVISEAFPVETMVEAISDIIRNINSRI